MHGLIDKMYDYGWDQIGEGGYSNVFQHPNYPYVVKVFIGDSLYLQYFMLVIKPNQNNPHVPKVRGKTMRVADEGYAVRLEQLTPLTSPEDPVLDKYLDPRFSKKRNAFETSIGLLFSKENLPFLRENWPELAEILKGIYRISIMTDFNSRNVMKRGDTIVITDPLAE